MVGSVDIHEPSYPEREASGVVYRLRVSGCHLLLAQTLVNVIRAFSDCRIL